MEGIEKGSLLVRVGAALSSLVLLGVSGLAYLLVADVYDTYPQLAYRTVFTVIGVLIPLPLAFFFGLRVKMCVWLGVSRGLDLAFLNAD